MKQQYVMTMVIEVGSEYGNEYGAEVVVNDVGTYDPETWLLVKDAIADAAIEEAEGLCENLFDNPTKERVDDSTGLTITINPTPIPGSSDRPGAT